MSIANMFPDDMFRREPQSRQWICPGPRRQTDLLRRRRLLGLYQDHALHGLPLAPAVARALKKRVERGDRGGRLREGPFESRFTVAMSPRLHQLAIAEAAAHHAGFEIGLISEEIQPSADGKSAPRSGAP